MVTLVHTKETEIPLAMEILNMAIAHLKSNGTDQWQGGYPNLAVVEEDIALKRGYFAMFQGEILGYLCIDFHGEPVYDKIDGQWASQEDYAVVHRMAFHEKFRGKKLGTQAFQAVEELVKAQSVRNFRIDTAVDNPTMQKVLENSGFTYRGMVYYDRGKRMAYDKLL